jgi:hypothetical protein
MSNGNDHAQARRASLSVLFCSVVLLTLIPEFQTPVDRFTRQNKTHTHTRDNNSGIFTASTLCRNKVATAASQPIENDAYCCISSRTRHTSTVVEEECALIFFFFCWPSTLCGFPPARLILSLSFSLIDIFSNAICKEMEILFSSSLKQTFIQKPPAGI